jgi:ribonuclease-3
MLDGLYQQLIKDASARIGYEFKHPDLLQQALTHKSFANEASHNKFYHNERLEFLGDAVLSLVIGEMLMNTYPQAGEGDLSRLRSSLVNAIELAKAALKLGLGELLLLGKGEEKSGGRKKDSILSDTFEAVLGAVYLDGGLAPSRQLIERALNERFQMLTSYPQELDPKTRLQELFQHQGHQHPRYRLVEVTGQPHRRLFVAAVIDDTGVERARGEGSSKKEAEQAAAHKLLDELSPNQSAESNHKNRSQPTEDT